MKRVFLVTLVKPGIAREHLILGFLSNNNKETIANCLKRKFNLILEEELINRFTRQREGHWEYSTNHLDKDIHVDICYNLDENGDE